MCRPIIHNVYLQIGVGRIKKGDIIQEATIEKTEVKVGADREEILHQF